MADERLVGAEVRAVTVQDEVRGIRGAIGVSLGRIM